MAKGSLLRHLIMTGILLGFCPARAQQSDFFASPEGEHFQLKAPFEKISQLKMTNQNFVEVKKAKFGGVLSYLVADKNIEVPVEINIKGFSSINICSLPKLELKIKQGEQTIFKGLKKIDLNTHCGDPAQVPANHLLAMFEGIAMNHREVVIYRMLESLGLTSYLTKTVQMAYIDSDTLKRPSQANKEFHQAFFVEDKSAFIKRLALSEILGVNDNFRREDVDSGKTQEEQYQFTSVAQNPAIRLYEVAKIEFLQNLVLNQDWFIKADKDDLRFADDKNGLWNMKIFKRQTNDWLVIAQDFNLAGINDHSVLTGTNYMIPASLKFYSRLNKDDKLKLLQDISTKKDEVVRQIDLIQKDPVYLKLKDFITKRIEFLIMTMEAKQ